MIKITIGTKENPVRFSYANVHQAVSVNGSDPKYSVSIIISKSDKQTIKKVKDAIQKATQENKDKFGSKMPSNLKNPLRDGDADREEMMRLMQILSLLMRTAKSNQSLWMRT